MHNLEEDAYWAMKRSFGGHFGFIFDDESLTMSAVGKANYAELKRYLYEQKELRPTFEKSKPAPHKDPKNLAVELLKDMARQKQ